jgi:hypothetical protein
MPLLPDPITSSTISSVLTFSYQAGKSSLLQIFPTVKDDWIIWRYRCHTSKGSPDGVIYKDIQNFQKSLKDSIKNEDISRVCRLFYKLLDECNKLSPISEIGVSLTIEDLIVGHSDVPHLVEDGLFALLIEYESFVHIWEEKYPSRLSSDGSGLEIPSYVSEKDFLTDNNFQSACLCLRVYYRTCLKIGELSIKDLIKVGNHFHLIASSGKDSPLYLNPHFSRIFLSIVIQIAAKAQQMEIEPTREKMVQILKYSIPILVVESFSVLENKENHYSTMGPMHLILATPKEIQNLIHQYYS